MECLLKPIKCTKCFEKLKKPVTLPCGNAICEKHQKEDRDDTNSIYCSACNLNHVIPEGGFVRNLPLEELIEQNIDCIDMGDEYNLANSKVKRFSDLIDRIETLKTNPENTIHDIISELKSDVDLRREELKNTIDEDALSIIKQLEEYEVGCKTNIVSIKGEIEDNTKLDELKENLNRWKHQMKSFKKDIDLLNKIHDESNSKYDKMKSTYDNLYKAIFLNRLEFYQDLKLFIGNDFDMIKYILNFFYYIYCYAYFMLNK